MSEPLKFIVAPHIVQDLGLNLYTSLPRVLVEFIANAYDADSPCAEVTLDKNRIDYERELLKNKWEAEKKINGSGTDSMETSLSDWTLPEDVEIAIADEGHGMARNELQTKFLVAGRRRREEKDGDRTPDGRVVMGRKGLGKLAGFGVAHRVTITSRKKGAEYATKITLDYDDISKVTDTNEIPVVDERIEDPSVLPSGGTRVSLTKLLFEPTKSRITTIENEIAEHFINIKPEDFQITMGGVQVRPAERKHVYGWPEPDLDVNELVETSLTTDHGPVTFQYRLKFVEDRKALSAEDRGVRIYAHNRLAAAPSLLGADTNMHGFRMTDYLDGVVVADFIDDHGQDYIATDRQNLRWETPLLEPLYELLSAQIKIACAQRQHVRDEENKKKATQDPYLASLIKGESLTKREQSVAVRMGAAVASLHKRGYDDDGYKNQIEGVVKSLGQGELFTALTALAQQDTPDMDRVVAEITRLTSDQLDGFYRYARGRLSGIAALRRLVTSVEFAAKKNEKQLQKLLSNYLKNPVMEPLGLVSRGI